MPELIAVAGLPEFEPGDSVGAEIASRVDLAGGDVVVISQKIVSKAEDRLRDLAGVEPGPQALELAAELGKDPAMVELVLTESRRVVRAVGGVLITETNTGLICANAGIDSSNVGGGGRVALLPADPDASARRIRGEIEAAAGVAAGGRDRRQLRAAVAARPGRGRDRLRRARAARRLARAPRPRRARARGDRDRDRRSARCSRRPGPRPRTAGSPSSSSVGSSVWSTPGTAPGR